MERQTQSPSLLKKIFGGVLSTKRERFESQAERVYPSVFNLALRLTRSREEAEDLAQEAVIRAYEAYDRFDGSNFKAWILRITTNAYINRYRQSQRIPSHIALDDDRTSEPADESELSPEQQLLENVLAPEVENALANLPEEFKMTVILSDIEGLTYLEVAEVLDIPVGTVRSRLARGRSLLRRSLAKYATQEGYINQEVKK